MALAPAVSYKFFGDAVPMDGDTEDCYYFLYSTCKRGASCCYRHNAFSKQNPVLCEEWAQTGACRVDCPFRHSTYHLQKRRADDLCYWEDREQGCTKEFCEFKHRDSAKDAWKEGGVKNIGQIRREKNARKQLDAAAAAPVDLEAFERERREKKLERRTRLEGRTPKSAGDAVGTKRLSTDAASGGDEHKKPRTGVQDKPAEAAAGPKAVFPKRKKDRGGRDPDAAGSTQKLDRSKIKVDDEKALDDEFEDLNDLLGEFR